jgi:hypothetical protein
MAFPPFRASLISSVPSVKENPLKRFILTIAIFASWPAWAGDEPATLVLPTPVVTSVVQYLHRQPYADVANMIAMIQQCVAVQIPNSQGAIVSRGECPTVTAALKQPSTER